ncbi:MAG: hypothetical protein M1281_19050 [Chloroflexi bacterium]|nr:hypothetical protein [Chloroflexota bacterium]
MAYEIATDALKEARLWTWCPKCMVRTPHTRQQTNYHCQACGCYHRGQLILPSPDNPPDQAKAPDLPV